MRPESLQSIALAVAEERSVDAVLARVVDGLAKETGVALVRVWLVAPGDVCSSCRMRPECPDQTKCLHLVASAGSPKASGREKWSRLEGDFRRFPLAVRKIGRIGASGSPILVEDVAVDSKWIARPEWAKRESIRSFAGQPLVFRGEILGVLAVFSRKSIDRAQFAWLRTFADHAAVAIANSRAFAEIARLKEKLELENSYLREEVNVALAAGSVVGEGPALRKVLEQIELVAPTGATVLITGESGTGKELVARRIHERSPRHHRPLITVNCASIPRELFESEFFGHVKGAFTGALRDRAGRFQAADGGTLFLDEVGEIPIDLQGKLLRALQEGEFERVGDEVKRRVDVRIVSATNRDLEGEVDAGRFRRDLYYRLGVFPIAIPPLRERPEDVPLLALHFVRLAAKRIGVPEPRLTPASVTELQRYDWPGNVRELQNVIERGVILSHGGPLRLDLPLRSVRVTPKSRGSERAAEPQFLHEDERRHRERASVLAALRHANGKIYGRGGAAELLGVKPTTLASRMKAMGIRKSQDHHS